MTLLNGKTSILDKLPRSILGQLVRDSLKVIGVNGIPLQKFRSNLFDYPTGRWCLNNPKTICDDNDRVDVLIPFYLLELLSQAGWTSESKHQVHLSHKGGQMKNGIKTSLSELRKDLRIKSSLKGLIRERDPQLVGLGTGE